MSRASFAGNERDLRVINRQLGLPQEGKGALVLSGAYGGGQIQQIVTDGYGVRSITYGYQPAGFIAAVIEGMSAALDLAEKQGFVAPTPPEGGRE